MPAAVDAKRGLVEPNVPHLSIVHQCELLGLSRSTYYLAPAVASAENLRLMRRIDEQYLKTPFYGSRRLTAVLPSNGEPVNRKRVQRLMRLMGLAGLFPGRLIVLPHSGILPSEPATRSRCFGPAQPTSQRFSPVSLLLNG